MNDTIACRSPRAAESPVGAEGGSGFGVTDTEAEKAPSPTAFTARNLIEYAVSFNRLGIVTGLVASSGLKAVQAPPLREYL